MSFQVTLRWCLYHFFSWSITSVLLSADVVPPPSEQLTVLSPCSFSLSCFSFTTSFCPSIVFFYFWLRAECQWWSENMFRNNTLSWHMLIRVIRTYCSAFLKMEAIVFSLFLPRHLTFWRLHTQKHKTKGSLRVEVADRERIRQRARKGKIPLKGAEHTTWPEENKTEAC